LEWPNTSYVATFPTVSSRSMRCSYAHWQVAGVKFKSPRSILSVSST